MQAQRFPMRRCAIIAGTFLITLVLTAPAGPQSSIVLNTANDPPNSTDEHTGLCDLILTEAFKRLGMTVKIVNLPSERALINANEGIDDGNFARVEGLDKTYPNLIRVPVAITKFEFTVFSKNPSLAIKNWESLSPYNVGIITGWKILEQNIVGTRSLAKVADESLLFNLLQANRVDLVVYDRMQGKALMKRVRMRGIHVLDPPLAERNMYLYLHKRHAVLADKLTKTLRGMEQDGTYKKISHDVLNAFL